MLRLQGLGLCDLKPDQCVASDQIDSYLEPDGRSEITSPSEKPLREHRGAGILGRRGAVGVDGSGESVSIRLDALRISLSFFNVLFLD
jgi:hypothetical protein